MTSTIKYGICFMVIIFVGEYNLILLRYIKNQIFLACFYVVFIHYETENEKIVAAEKNFGETEAAKTILFGEFHEEIEELLKKISSLDSQISSLDFQTLENKIDTIEWKVDSSSDPSFWKESNDNLPENENKHIETEPIQERKGFQSQ